jgi:AraC-like DNA-binding protein
MRALATEAEFDVDGPGAYVSVPCGLVFHAAPDLWGIVIWGRPTPAMVERQIHVLRTTHLQDGVPRHRMLVDLSRLESADPAVFQRFADYIREESARLAKRVTTLALIRPVGVVGAAVSGFFDMVAPPYPVRHFASSTAAGSWLGTNAGALDEIARVASAAGAAPAQLAQLRSWLEARAAAARLSEGAKMLGISPRALQRLLMAHDTSFSDELRAARIRIAKDRLATTTLTVAEIAYELGCGTPQYFSSMFRRIVGMTPSEWRRRHVGVVS